MTAAIQLCPKTTAAILRKVLRHAFPAVKFSVTTGRGSLVSAVDVRWTDGPTSARVREFSDLFTSGRFDGMTDSYDYATGADRFVQVENQTYRTGCRYVETHREISPALARRCVAQVAAYLHVEAPVVVEFTGWDGKPAWKVENDSPLPSWTGNGRAQYWSEAIYEASSDATRYTLNTEAA